VTALWDGFEGVGYFGVYTGGLPKLWLFAKRSTTLPVGGSLFRAVNKISSDVLWFISLWDGTSCSLEKLHCSWMFWNVEVEEMSDGSLMLEQCCGCIVTVVMWEVRGRQKVTMRVISLAMNLEMHALIHGPIPMLIFYLQHHDSECAFGTYVGAM